MFIKHFVLLGRRGDMWFVKLFPQLGLRLLVNEPSKGKKKILFSSVSDPTWGSKDDGDRVEMGRQGRKGCLLFGV